LLDAHASATRDPVEKVRRKILAERLDAEVREQRVARRVAAVPQDHAETARIAQAQRRAAENEVEVIVLARS
jgi:DNA-binding HxlR family transcriptional regulator